MAGKKNNSSRPTAKPSNHDQSPAVEAEKDSHLIVAIGASAGGLKAYQDFFSHMPPDSGMAFVLIQHLSPTHESTLPQILSRCTMMPVAHAVDDTKLEPNVVNVVPPNAQAWMQDGVLRLSPPREPRDRTPIDGLFRSLAEEDGSRAVCIIMSGGGADGSIGLRAIKEHGGLALAQCLDSAVHDSMPRNAAATRLVDYVLAAEEMPRKLLEYKRHLATRRKKNDDRTVDTAVQDHMAEICAAICRGTGHDFSLYKQSTMTRRIERRMQVRHLLDVDEYIRVLRDEPTEVGALFNDLLISVTAFFRDPAAFEVLAAAVVPQLLDNRAVAEGVRIWVPGCATAEEAYSIAILLTEHTEKGVRGANVRTQIFATDLDEAALDVGRRGLYSAQSVANISPQRLERFFVSTTDGYRVKKDIRQLCVFSSHNVISDPPFSNLDLISCRNLLIYLEGDLQKRLIPLFHYALRPSGYLFLGPSENVASNPDLFRVIDKKHRVYQRREVPVAAPVPFPLVRGTRPALAPGHSPKSQNVAEVLDRVLLSHFTPSGVLINEQGQAVFFLGKTGKYVEPPSGDPSTDIVAMARRSLRGALRAAIHKARKANASVVEENVALEVEGGIQRLNLIVRSVPELGADSGYLLVLFQDIGGVRAVDAAAPEAPAVAADGAAVEHLEAELRKLREHLQATVEELETSNEELKSSNEELLSMNEELQSGNEELEMSKEELQSLNEELETVNTELNHKLGELDAVYSDLQNVFQGTHIATLFVDSRLRIKNFTPATAAVLRLIETDVGRPLADIATRIADGDLLPDIQGVIRTLVMKERQVCVPESGLWYTMRILPYRTAKNVIEGVVVTFADVTSLKRAEALMEEARAFVQKIVDTGSSMLLVLDKDLRVRAASAAFYRKFGADRRHTENRPVFELGERQWDVPTVRELLSKVVSHDAVVDAYEVTALFEGLGERIMLLSARRLSPSDDADVMVLLSIEDVTDRRAWERELEEHRSGLQELLAQRTESLRLSLEQTRHMERLSSIGTLAAGIAHEINNPLNAILLTAEQGLRVPGSSAEEAFAIIKAEAQRGGRVVKSILKFARDEHSPREPADLNAIVEHAVELVRTYAPAAGWTPRLNLAPSLPSILLNPTEIEQVIVNLMTNAVEAASDPVELEIRTAVVDGWVRMTVSDNGPGIPPEILHHIFDPFFSTRRGAGGTGLGLSICHGIVCDHGGTIEVESRVGKGTTFTVCLPVSESPAR